MGTVVSKQFYELSDRFTRGEHYIYEM